MKKRLLAISACALLPAMLIACSPAPKTAANHVQDTPTRQTPVSEENSARSSESGRNVYIIAGEGLREFVMGGTEKLPRSGVTRKLLPSLDGSYSVEYIHTPYGVDKDDTLDYKLELSDDNTFTMHVVTNGVTADHSGHWYVRHDNMTLFYDEEIDPTAHNYFVSDSMYCEILPQNKLMIYDDCRVIVLSRNDSATPDA